MAHFRGVVRNDRGEASRLGSKLNGLETIANGWNVGVRVEAHHTSVWGDCFAVWATGGSNGSARTRRYLGTVRLVDDTPVFTPAFKPEGE